MSKLFSVEYENGSEVRIHLDPQGGDQLVSLLTRLLASRKKEHIHLATDAWGGAELTEDPSSEGSEKINMLTIHFWPGGKEAFEEAIKSSTKS
jgi:hypothetical protein